MTSWHSAAGEELQASTAEFEIIKPVKKGEELLMSYVNQDTLSKGVRQQKLKAWLAEECRCVKCEKDE